MLERIIFPRIFNSTDKISNTRKYNATASFTPSNDYKINEGIC